MTYIDDTTLKALNIDLILGLITPVSDAGKRYKLEQKSYLPGEEDKVKEEYFLISLLMNLIEKKHEFFERISSELSHLPYIRLILEKLSNNYNLELYEIFEIKHFLFYYNNVYSLINQTDFTNYFELHDLSEVFRLLDPENQNLTSFYISSKYSDKLTNLRNCVHNLNLSRKKQLEKYIELVKNTLNLQEVKKKVTISKLNTNLYDKFLNSDFFYIEDDNFANTTFALKLNAELLDIDKSMSELMEEMAQETERVLVELSGQLSIFSQKLLDSLRKMALFDWFLSKAHFALINDCTIPEISSFDKDSLYICIKNGVNLPVEKNLKLSDIEYQPITIEFTKNINILTGANMGGKSSFLKLFGQFAFLTSFAIPLPCNKAVIPLWDFIFYNGDKASENRVDLSSFAYEVVELNKAVNISGKGLFLLDEFARGTNPIEGEAFSRAFIEAFFHKNAFLLAATHYNSPKYIQTAGHFKITGINADQKIEKNDRQNLVDRIKSIHKYMDYQIEEVKKDNDTPKAALIIARMLGVNEDILKKAKKYLSDNFN